MNHKRFMALPTNICILVFSGVFLLTALFTYFLHEDTLLLERRIASRQKDLGTVIQLRDSYETKRQAFEKYAPDRSDQRGMSLAVMEAIVAKSFVGGSLASLQPTTSRQPRTPAYVWGSFAFPFRRLTPRRSTCKQLWLKDVSVDRPKRLLFFVSLIFWGLFVVGLVLYLCFPSL